MIFHQGWIWRYRGRIARFMRRIDYSHSRRWIRLTDVAIARDVPAKLGRDTRCADLEHRLQLSPGSSLSSRARRSAVRLRVGIEARQYITRKYSKKSDTCR